MPMEIKGTTETQRGLMLMVGGLLVLLYAFNLFTQSLNLLVILSGITMVGYGFMKIGGIEKIKQLINQK